MYCIVCIVLNKVLCFFNGSHLSKCTIITQKGSQLHNNIHQNCDNIELVLFLLCTVSTKPITMVTFSSASLKYSLPSASTHFKCKYLIKHIFIKKHVVVSILIKFNQFRTDLVH